MLLAMAEANGFAQQYSPYGNGADPQAYAPPNLADEPSGGQYNPAMPGAQLQAPAQPLAADQLQQLVAPIALYPDTLMALVLAAATYPAQVAAADHWLRAQGNAPPEQIAAAADAQPWDPSVKALTAFPQVLQQMDGDLAWTTDLGNAYYNQPQDVLQTVQVMRQRAEDAGTLRSTPQEAVTYNQGYIQLAPANPEVVYVPAYNPWDAYGQPVQPYPGFSLLGALQSFAGSAPVRYGLGIGMSAFRNTSFGWMGWALNWLTQSVFFHQSPYYSQSTTVARWGNPRGGQGGFSKRGWGGGQQEGRQGFVRPPVRNPQGYGENRGGEDVRRGYAPQAGNYERPALQNYAYNRPAAPMPTPARPQAYGRPGYGSSFYGGNSGAYAATAPRAYASPQQTWRGAAPTQQRAYPMERSYAMPMARSFAGSPSKPEGSGGFHLFGGGHKDENRYGGGRAPKGFSGGKAPKQNSHGGGHSGGHSGGGHHWL
jgi:hypothetical protein